MFFFEQQKRNASVGAHLSNVPPVKFMEFQKIHLYLTTAYPLRKCTQNEVLTFQSDRKDSENKPTDHDFLDCPQMHMGSTGYGRRIAGR